MATLTPDAEEFSQKISRGTGLDINVVRSWVAIESRYGLSKLSQGNKNYLNLKNAQTGGWRQFSSVSESADAVIAQLNRRPEWYGGILKSAGRSPLEQITAIASSPWDAGHYGGAGGPNLKKTYVNVAATYSGPGGLPTPSSPPISEPGLATPAGFNLFDVVDSTEQWLYAGALLVIAAGLIILGATGALGPSIKGVLETTIPIATGAAGAAGGK